MDLETHLWRAIKGVKVGATPWLLFGLGCSNVEDFLLVLNDGGGSANEMTSSLHSASFYVSAGFHGDAPPPPSFQAWNGGVSIVYVPPSPIHIH